MVNSVLVEDELLYLDPGWQVARNLRSSDQEADAGGVIDWVVSGPNGSLIAIGVVRNLGQQVVDDVMRTAAYDLSVIADELGVGFDAYVVVIEGVVPSGAHSAELELPRCGRPVRVVYVSRLPQALASIDAGAQGSGMRTVSLDELLASGSVVSDDLSHC